MLPCTRITGALVVFSSPQMVRWTGVLIRLFSNRYNVCLLSTAMIYPIISSRPLFLPLWFPEPGRRAFRVRLGHSLLVYPKHSMLCSIEQYKGYEQINQFFRSIDRQEIQEGKQAIAQKLESPLRKKVRIACSAETFGASGKFL